MTTINTFTTTLYLWFQHLRQQSVLNMVDEFQELRVEIYIAVDININKTYSFESTLLFLLSGIVGL